VGGGSGIDGLQFAEKPLALAGLRGFTWTNLGGFPCAGEFGTKADCFPTFRRTRGCRRGILRQIRALVRTVFKRSHAKLRFLLYVDRL
jgi:hypothetical protein